MARLIDAAVATTRRIVTDLRPSILDDLGLAVALRWQAGEYGKRSATRIVVETPEPDIAVDRECALTLFRIFQETLTNVMRHANATEVFVRLAEADACYVLQIRDNGVGMPDDALRKPDIARHPRHARAGPAARRRRVGDERSGRGDDAGGDDPQAGERLTRRHRPASAASAQRRDGATDCRSVPHAPRTAGVGRVL